MCPLCRQPFAHTDAPKQSATVRLEVAWPDEAEDAAQTEATGASAARPIGRLVLLGEHPVHALQTPPSLAFGFEPRPR
jgi:hypothetical protein